MKKILWFLCSMACVGILYAQPATMIKGHPADGDQIMRVDSSSRAVVNVEKSVWGTLALPVYSVQNSTGVTIYNSTNTANINAITLYIVGGTTTSAATYNVYESSMYITTAGGLYPGTTFFLFSDTYMDTLGEFINYYTDVLVSTDTVGLEGGIVMSTSAITNAPVLTTCLTAAQSGSCLGLANIKTLTATPVVGRTFTLDVNADSMTFVSTNGLYPGTTGYIFPAAETLEGMETRLEAWPATTVGLDGTLVITIPNGTYGLSLSSHLAEIAPVSLIGVENNRYLAIENVYGMSYTIPAATNGDSICLTNLVVNATFASGTAYVNIYDGATRAGTQLRHEKITTTAVDHKIEITLDDFYGSADTAMTIEIVGSASVTASYMNFTYKKRQ